MQFKLSISYIELTMFLWKPVSPSVAMSQNVTVIQSIAQTSIQLGTSHSIMSGNMSCYCYLQYIST